MAILVSATTNYLINFPTSTIDCYVYLDKNEPVIIFIFIKMNQRKYRRKLGGKVMDLGSTDSVSSKKDRSSSGSKGFFDYVNRKLSPNNFPSFQKLNFSTSSKFNFVPPASTKRD